MIVPSAVIRTAQHFNRTTSQRLNSASGTSSRLTPRESRGVPGHVIDDRREVGGSVELHRLQALVVSFQNPLNTVAVGVVDVAVLGRTNTLRSSKQKSYFSFER